jgi:hypothetical protein
MCVCETYYVYVSLQANCMYFYVCIAIAEKIQTLDIQKHCLHPNLFLNFSCMLLRIMIMDWISDIFFQRLTLYDNGT